MASVHDTTATGKPSAFRWSGISLKTQHFQQVLETEPPVSFFEVHAENYMVDGGANHRFLEAIRASWPLSIHGVGLSLGSADGIDTAHLDRLAGLVDRYRPGLVSEHLAWAADNGTYLNDLLPVPLTAESLETITGNVNRVQDRLGRKLLLENPSSYLSFRHSHIQEADFLMEITSRTGCGLLLDMNNIFVSASNLGSQPADWLDTIDPEVVGEIHLAGHTTRDVDGVTVRIDDHGSRVCEEVWQLFERWTASHGAVPTLVEWDSNVPGLDVLVQEASLAEAAIERATSGKEAVCA